MVACLAVVSSSFRSGGASGARGYGPNGAKILWAGWGGGWWACSYSFPGASRAPLPLATQTNDYIESHRKAVPLYIQRVRNECIDTNSHIRPFVRWHHFATSFKSGNPSEVQITKALICSWMTPSSKWPIKKMILKNQRQGFQDQMTSNSSLRSALIRGKLEKS